MSQVTITNFFNKRKRQVDDFKTRSKVLVLEREVSASIDINNKVDKTINAVKVDLQSLSPISQSKQKSQGNCSVSAGKQKVVRFDESKNTVRVNVIRKASSLKTKAPNYDIRKSFQKSIAKAPKETNAPTDGKSEEEREHQATEVVEEVPHDVSELQENAVVSTEASSDPKPELIAGGDGVGVQAEASLKTPTKITSQWQDAVGEAPGATSVLLESVVVSTEARSGPEREVVAGSSGVGVQVESSLMTPTKNTSQELTLSDIKLRLSRSEKLRQAMSSFSKAAAKCAQLSAARKELDKAGPQLENFEKVKVEFCTSPQKAAQRSPEKRAAGSPLKGSTLPLPFSYRGLAEVFRCVDTVVSMLYNRSETVTFKKVKAAVQEMLHRTFTEYHLGQIKTVFPDAYIFHQEKLRNFGSTSKADMYELTIMPVLSASSKNEDGLVVSGEETSRHTDKLMMTPTCILERKRTFYNNLLERVFVKHEEFLSSLDPPLVIPYGELARWHPQFEVDTIDEIATQELPQPPNVKKFTSAKDVLDRARDLFSCNQRMQTALEKMSADVSQKGSQSAVSTRKDIISPSKQDSVQSALKGIPKSLLDKVRARQAAKARLAMTCLVDDKESVEHSRLPELARILRNMFVTEKKAALPLETAILKLQNSYREKLSARELQHHIQLMVELLPGWIAIYSIRNSDYLKLSRNGDISKVIQKLEATALEKKNTQILEPA